MKLSFSWSFLILFVALILPVDLPAGGSFNKKDNGWEFNNSNIYFANDSCHLRSHPDASGFCLRQIPLGTPLRLMRTWKNIDGSLWFQVQIYSLEMIDNNTLPIRGWVSV